MFFMSSDHVFSQVNPSAGTLADLPSRDAGDGVGQRGNDAPLFLKKPLQPSVYAARSGFSQRGNFRSIETPLQASVYEGSSGARKPTLFERPAVLPRRDATALELAPADAGLPSCVARKSSHPVEPRQPLAKELPVPITQPPAKEST